MEDSDLYAALLHELKNNLVLLTITLDSIPRHDDDVKDAPLDSARLLGQRTSDRLMQALLIYKSSKSGIVLNAVDAYSPEDFVRELAQHALALKDSLEIELEIGDDVPAIWFFDRNMLEMALINAVHNSIMYARRRILIQAGLSDGMLAISIRDDSDGYPAHIIDAVDAGTTLQSNGTGLGLRFARLIAEAHRNEGRTGEIHLYNDHGAVFEIRVP